MGAGGEKGGGRRAPVLTAAFQLFSPHLALRCVSVLADPGSAGLRASSQMHPLSSEPPDEQGEGTDGTCSSRWGLEHTGSFLETPQEKGQRNGSDATRKTKGRGGVDSR